MHGWDRTGGWLLQAARPCIEDHESPSPPDQPAYPPAGEYVRQAMVEAVQLSFPRASAQGGASARTCGTSVINKPPLVLRSSKAVHMLCLGSLLVRAPSAWL